MSIANSGASITVDLLADLNTPEDIGASWLTTIDTQTFNDQTSNGHLVFSQITGALGPRLGIKVTGQAAGTAGSIYADLSIDLAMKAG